MVQMSKPQTSAVGAGGNPDTNGELRRFSDAMYFASSYGSCSCQHLNIIRIHLYASALTATWCLTPLSLCP